jgi:hypothetical protein
MKFLIDVYLFFHHRFARAVFLVERRGIRLIAHGPPGLGDSTSGIRVNGVSR